VVVVVVVVGDDVVVVEVDVVPKRRLETHWNLLMSNVQRPEGHVDGE